MEYRDFDSFEDLAEYNSRDLCYVAYQSMVFNVTDTLEEMDNVDVKDCGRNITGKFTPEEGEAFHDLNIDNYVGFVHSEVELLDDPEYNPFDVEYEEVILEQTQEDVDIVENGDSDIGAGSMILLALVFIVILAILVKGAMLLSSSFGKKKVSEVKKGEENKEEVKKDK